ncbi:MAG: hypothetical protein WKF31_13130 [Thermoleophilaceae bacterium]
MERYRAFEDWFKHTQDIPGAFYLWIVEHLFRDNKLINGELEIAGRAGRPRQHRRRRSMPARGRSRPHHPSAAGLRPRGLRRRRPADQVVKRTTSGGPPRALHGLARRSATTGRRSSPRSSSTRRRR